MRHAMDAPISVRARSIVMWRRSARHIRRVNKRQTTRECDSAESAPGSTPRPSTSRQRSPPPSPVVATENKQRYHFPNVLYEGARVLKRSVGGHIVTAATAVYHDAGRAVTAR